VSAPRSGGLLGDASIRLTRSCFAQGMMVMGKSRIVCFCLCVGALQIWPAFARGDGLTLGNIAAALRALPVIPIQKFEERELIPGTPVFGIKNDHLHGVDVLRALNFETCPIENPKQWFRARSTTVTFNSHGPSELEDLRALLGAAAGAMDDIDNVDVKFDAWSLNAPYPYVQENFAKTLSSTDCMARRNHAQAAIIIRPIEADITLTFVGRNLTRDRASVFVAKTDPAPEVSEDGTKIKITLSHRLVALMLGESP
jgi:hypothetical protein